MGDNFFSTMRVEKSGITKGKNRITYYNIPFAAASDDNSVLVCNGDFSVTMKPNQFVDFLKFLGCQLRLTESDHAVIYSYNLQVLFQRVRKYIKVTEMFATAERKAVKVMTEEGVELRDAAILAGVNLRDIPLFCNTSINDPEHSLFNEARLISDFIRYKAEEDGGIANIKITSTQYVRCGMRNHLLNTQNEKSRRKNRIMIESLKMEEEEYRMARRAFCGGFCAYNQKNKGEILENVQSWDMGSAYIYQMITRKYPMGKGQKVEIESLQHLKDLQAEHLLIMDIELDDVQLKPGKIAVIKESDIDTEKAFDCTDDGYVTYAAEISLTVTDQDIDVLRKHYSVGGFRVTNAYCYKSDYLPIEMINYILDLYEDKSKYKRDGGPRYQYAKQLLNACFGILVQRIEQDDIIYNPESKKIDTMGYQKGRNTGSFRSL